MLEWLGMMLIWKFILSLVGIPPENYYNQGNRLYHDGEYAKAEASYRHAFESKILASRAYFNAGNALFSQGEYAAAVECYEASLDLEPDDEDAWFNLELARRKAGEQVPSAQAQANDSRRQPPSSRQNTSQKQPGLSGNRPPEGKADQILSRARRREEVLYQFHHTQSGTRQLNPNSGDIFTQTPEQIVETMREMTRAGYPFRPGTSLEKPKPQKDDVDW